MSSLNAIPRLSGSLTGRNTALVGNLSSAGESLSGTLVGSSHGGGTELQPATTSTLGGIIVGDDLTITEEGRLSVLKATAVESDNTRPITSAAVFVTVGNINALLQTI